MAASLALKRLLSSSLLPKSLRASRPAVPAAQSATRFFNASTARDFEDDDDERSLDVDRRFNRSAFRGGEFCPSSFSARSLNQILNVMDQMMDSPFAAMTRGMGSGLRRGWDARETDDGLYLRMEMPGLGKENVKISVEQNTLIIKGEGERDADDEESGRRYTNRIDLPEKLYQIDQIKAEMKNGVLKVVLPKVKEEDRSDVFHVKVE